jgi:hypothetical protein
LNDLHGANSPHSLNSPTGSSAGSVKGFSQQQKRMSRVDTAKRQSMAKAADISKEFEALMSSAKTDAPSKQNSFDSKSDKPLLDKIPSRLVERKGSFKKGMEPPCDDPDRISYTPASTVQRKLQRKTSIGKIELDASDMSYSELQDVEKRRMEYRTFSFHEGKDLLLRLADTVLVDILIDPNFWLTGVVYGVVTSMREFGLIDADDSTMASVAALGGFISFLLVFFLNECYLRYKAQYLEQVRGMNIIISIAEWGHSFMSNKDRVLQIVRYLNVAHIFAFTGMTEIYAESNLLVPMVDEFNLLTRKELELIRSFDVDDDGKGALTWLVPPRNYSLRWLFCVLILLSLSLLLLLLFVCRRVVLCSGYTTPSARRQKLARSPPKPAPT